MTKVVKFSYFANGKTRSIHGILHEFVIYTHTAMEDVYMKQNRKVTLLFLYSVTQ